MIFSGLHLLGLHFGWVQFKTIFIVSCAFHVCNCQILWKTERWTNACGVKGEIWVPINCLDHLDYYTFQFWESYSSSFKHFLLVRLCPMTMDYQLNLCLHGHPNNFRCIWPYNFVSLRGNFSLAVHIWSNSLWKISKHEFGNVCLVLLESSRQWVEQPHRLLWEWARMS